MSSPLIVGELTVRGLLRRRVAMAILVVLPLLLYVARHDHVGQSIRGLLFGVSWAVTTVAYFAATANRDAEPRLCLAGWTWPKLVGTGLGDAEHRVADRSGIVREVALRIARREPSQLVMKVVRPDGIETITTPLS